MYTNSTEIAYLLDVSLLLLLVAAALTRLTRPEDGQLAHDRPDDQIQQNDGNQRRRKVRTETVEIRGDLGRETQRQTGLSEERKNRKREEWKGKPE